MAITHEEFKEIRKKVPLIVVDGVLFRNEGVLMVKRATEPIGYWALPGGFVDRGERLEHAIVRETKEETGLDVEVEKMVGIYDDPSRDPRGHMISVCFLLKLVGGKIATSPETSKVKFFGELPENIAFDHKQMIMDAKKLLKDRG